MAERLYLFISRCDGAFQEATFFTLRGLQRLLTLDISLREMIGLSVAEQVAVLVPEASPNEWPILKNSRRLHYLGRVCSPDSLLPLACVCLENSSVVGDTRFDIETAVNVGVASFGVALDRYNVHGLTSVRTQEIRPGFMARNRFVSERLPPA